MSKNNSNQNSDSVNPTEPTGFMRLCETCSGTGGVNRGDDVRICPDCEGSGIYPDSDEPKQLSADERAENPLEYFAALNLLVNEQPFSHDLKFVLLSLVATCAEQSTVVAALEARIVTGPKYIYGNPADGMGDELIHLQRGYLNETGEPDVICGYNGTADDKPVPGIVYSRCQMCFGRLTRVVQDTAAVEMGEVTLVKRINPSSESWFSAGKQASEYGIEKEVAWNSIKTNNPILDIPGRVAFEDGYSRYLRSAKPTTTHHLHVNLSDYDYKTLASLELSPVERRKMTRTKLRSCGKLGSCGYAAVSETDSYYITPKGHFALEARKPLPEAEPAPAPKPVKLTKPQRAALERLAQGWTFTIANYWTDDRGRSYLGLDLPADKINGVVANWLIKNKYVELTRDNKTQFSLTSAGRVVLYTAKGD